MIQYVEDLLAAHRAEAPPWRPQKLSFLGCSGYDVYNPTAPFSYQGETLMIGRVERRDLEHSKTMFFRQVEEHLYQVMTTMPQYDLQDPFLCKIGSYFVFGGTEMFPHPKNPGALWWRTKFFYGRTLEGLKPLTTGPNGMKDIRIVELQDGCIGVFGRPQGLTGGRGKISFGIVDDIFSLYPEGIQKLSLLHQFADDEWGGVNEAHLLPSGEIGVLGHIACFSDEDGGGERHYYPMAFTIDPQTKTPSKIKILAERSEFLPGDSKRADLADVLFTAGAIFHGDHATLYTGVSDCEVHSIEIENPF